MGNEYMIKDKITPVLKEKFRQVIDKTANTGKGYGFFICSDEQGRLYPAKSCEGDECKIILEDQSTACPVRIQGDFHTYPYLANTKRKYKEFGKQIPIDDMLKQEVRKSLTEMHEEKGVIGISPIVPDYKDSLNTIVYKCFRNTNISTCVGSDLDKDKIECWTPKDIGRGQCIRAMFDLRNIVGKKKEFFPKKWIVPLFDKEQITI